MRVMPSSVEGLVFEGDGLEPGTHAELMQGLSDVLVDSAWTDTELLRDRFCREPGSDPGQDCQRSSKTGPVVPFENGTMDPRKWWGSAAQCWGWCRSQARSRVGG